MERPAILKMLVLSIRTNVREIQRVLEELNGGDREATYPKTLARCFRTIEHDARAAALDRFADVVAAAKEASAGVYLSQGGDLVELLGEAAVEFSKAADAVDAGKSHRLDEELSARLKRAAERVGKEKGPLRMDPRDPFGGASRPS